MTKAEFLSELEVKLSGLPTAEVSEHIAFYSEMIDDRVEEGLTEEVAVAELGGVKRVASGIIADIPLAKLARKRLEPKRSIESWKIVLIILGSPLWISLAAAVLAVILSFYIAVFSVVLSLWTLFAALAASALGGILAGPVIIFTGGITHGFLLISAALIAAGIAILTFFGCICATRGARWLIRALLVGIKKLFIK